MIRTTAFLCLGLWLMPASVWADEDKEPVVVQMEAFKVITEDNVEKRKAADAAYPNDVLEYVATYRNQSDHSVGNLKATLPIPVGVEYLPGSEKPKGAVASTDGIKFAAMPLTRKVKLPSGEWEVQKIPYNEYRALRWNLKVLDAGKAKVVSARVRVSPLENQ